MGTPQVDQSALAELMLAARGYTRARRAYAAKPRPTVHDAKALDEAATALHAAAERWNDATTGGA